MNRLCVTNTEVIGYFKIVDKKFKLQIDYLTVSNRIVNGTPIDPVYLKISQKPVLKNKGRIS